jgi:hypothetical protein
MMRASEPRWLADFGPERARGVLSSPIHGMSFQCADLPSRGGSVRHSQIFGHGCGQKELISPTSRCRAREVYFELFLAGWSQ